MICYGLDDVMIALIKPGDFIRYEDAEEAAEDAERLGANGYEWDFVFEVNGKKGIWIEILGRSED